MLRILVCSPFSGTEEQRAANVKTASELCRRLCQAGAAPLAPHLHYPAFLNPADPQENDLGIRCGLAWLEVADALVAFTGAGISAGMAAEISAAEKSGKPVAFLKSLDDPLRFKHQASLSFRKLEKAWLSKT